MCGMLARMYPPEDRFSPHSVLSIITNQLHSIIHNTQKNLQHNFYWIWGIFFYYQASFCISETSGLEFEP